ncbi:MAG: hypothetical protein KDD69_19930 [Bdellovibrionales bacterium]|nr:hypothetical protein [Bdellovibrionales bacterium]
MNKRHLITAVAASLISIRRSNLSNAAPKRPRPMVDELELAPGLRLNYYHVVPSSRGSWGILSEYENLLDRVFDAPWMLVRFGDKDGNTLFQEYASSVRRIVRPGETSVFHTYVNEPSRTVGWTVFSVSMCRDGWGRTEAADAVKDIDFEIVKDAVDESASGYLRGYVDIKNIGTAPSLNPRLFIISRNDKGQATDITQNSVDGPIQPDAFSRTDVSAQLYQAETDFEFVPVEDASRGIFC